MHLRPLHDRILVQRLDEGEQRSGGIIIPDSAKEKPQRGKVIAAGNGKTRDSGDRVGLDVKAGDLILFGKYSGQEVKLDGVEYLIMKEDDVLAAIEAASTARAVAAKPPTAKAITAEPPTAKAITAKAATAKTVTRKTPAGKGR
jgi:chaperonin GroES